MSHHLTYLRYVGCQASHDAESTHPVYQATPGDMRNGGFCAHRGIAVFNYAFSPDRVPLTVRIFFDSMTR
jgi:hypothetical protein